MLNASQWLDWYKRESRTVSDYALAKRWGVSTSHVSQWRRERLRLPLAVILDIAVVLKVDPLEIITALEYPRSPLPQRERIKSAYFKALEHTVGRRMSATRERWRK